MASLEASPRSALRFLRASLPTLGQMLLDHFSDDLTVSLAGFGRVLVEGRMLLRSQSDANVPQFVLTIDPRSPSLGLDDRHNASANLL